MQYHYTRDLIENVVVVSYIPATEEQADVLTKEYVGKNFVRLRDSLMGSIMKWVRGNKEKDVNIAVNSCVPVSNNTCSVKRGEG